MEINMDLMKLRVKMIISYPFFGALLHKMEHVESERIPTAGTNGKVVYYNPNFMDKLSQDEQLFVMAHEVLHAALDHINRFTSYTKFNKNSVESQVWNIAADFLINDLLVNEQQMKMPSCGLLDNKYKFMDWSTEKLFKELMKNVKVQKLLGQPGAFSGGDMMPSEGLSEADAAKEAREWQIAVNQAAIVAKQAGNVPASIERLIERLLKPRVDWREALQSWFSAKIKENNDWSSPNRRYVSSHFYLPRKRTEHIGEIVVAIDTSGSIGQEELNAFGSELNYIFETAKPSKITVLYCDAAINKVQEFTNDDLPLSLTPVGGGGTSFKPPFDWVTKHLQNDICGLVYMTDMYGDFPSKAPTYPVVWLATSEIKAPFGEVIEYTISK